MKKIFLLFVTLICSLSLGCIYTSTALARIYTTIHVPTRTDDVFHFKIKWWWSKKPTFNLIDTIGIMWRTNDPNNTRRILNNRSYPTGVYNWSYCRFWTTNSNELHETI